VSRKAGDRRKHQQEITADATQREIDAGRAPPNPPSIKAIKTMSQPGSRAEI